MVGVLVDACGWVALVEARLNLDSSMEDVVGAAELKLLECVDKEIESVSKKQKGLLLESDSYTHLTLPTIYSV